MDDAKANMNKITVALVGNPNSGKSSVFNMITGARQHVANYPGVTVDLMEGHCVFGDTAMTIYDLPGTYSLTAYSMEELIARSFILERKPDVVVDVLDASNLERNLYLATQLMEMNVPLVLVFNMADLAEQKGLVFDTERLSELLETPIVHTVASRQQGKLPFLQTLVDVSKQRDRPRRYHITYGDEIETEIDKIIVLLREHEPQFVKEDNLRWVAVKLLEQDGAVLDRITSQAVKNQVTQSLEHLRYIFAESPEIIMTDRRYGYISGACQECIRTTAELRHNTSDMIDTVVINRYLGLPIFLVLMYLVFQVTFTLGQYPMHGLEWLFDFLSARILAGWPGENLLWLRSLIVDGIIGGVGGVVVFLPHILLLFLGIAFLEDSGYMARAAFVMDRFMHKIGLHGKSFIPMLIGFGCAVPAIMATRILENRRNRLTTIMVLPLFSCGAKYTIYALLVPAFFPLRWRAPVLGSVYLIGIVIAIIAARLLRSTLFKGETVPYVMELPPYRMPTFKAMGIHTWQRGWLYLKKAGTVILAISIILWALMYFPKPPQELLTDMSPQQVRQAQLEYSVVGRVGKAIEPAIRPLGFDWRIGTALIGATAAKEVFISQLGIIYSVAESENSEQTLQDKLKQRYSPLQGFCVMIFSLIATPCVATVAVTRLETRSLKWALFQFFGLTALGYIVTLIVYQAVSVII